jgi:hypothetical protein
MRTPLRPVAVLALCAGLLSAAPVAAAAATHAKSAAHAKRTKPHKRKPAKPPLTLQGDGGAVYGSGSAATTPPAASANSTSATGGAGGGASAPAGSSTGSTAPATKATTVSSSVNVPSVNTGATGASGPIGADGPSGATGASGTTTTGGASAPSPSGATGPSGPTGATGPIGPTTPGPVAKILASGLAQAPAGAPLAVKQAIAAGNQLIGQPYVYGGGHKSFISHGYDCSGAVSYALHGGGLLASPLDSGSLEQWGSAGRGAWITVFTNPTHVYVDIAGIRFDTSRAGDPGGKTGPRWRPLLASNVGFVARHPAGL